MLNFHFLVASTSFLFSIRLRFTPFCFYGTVFFWSTSLLQHLVLSCLPILPSNPHPIIFSSLFFINSYLSHPVSFPISYAAFLLPSPSDLLPFLSCLLTRSILLAILLSFHPSTSFPSYLTPILTASQSFLSPSFLPIPSLRLGVSFTSLPKLPYSRLTPPSTPPWPPPYST